MADIEKTWWEEDGKFYFEIDDAQVDEHTYNLSDAEEVSVPYQSGSATVAYTPGSTTPRELTEEELEANESIIQANTHNKNIEAVNDVTNKDNDWRVRLRLADSADYLYKAPEPGILAPLRQSDGLIFPYTPQIAIQYTADYENYDLTHSNHKGYFYRGSKIENIVVQATFTANDVREANYMLAAMHFLRSASKMFYGQDSNRGMPPPVVFLSGLGEYQFNNHPCAITMFQYNLPNDVDYIPCGLVAQTQPVKEPSSPISSPKARLGSMLQNDNEDRPTRINPAYTKSTYVPTKMEMNFTMIPIQTRDQISKEFSLKDYANGKLLKKGFW